MPRSKIKVEISIHEVIINSAKPTVIEVPRKSKRKRDICTFDFWLRVKNKHAWLPLIQLRPHNWAIDVLWPCNLVAVGRIRTSVILWPFKG